MTEQFDQWEIWDLTSGNMITSKPSRADALRFIRDWAAEDPTDDVIAELGVICLAEGVPGLLGADLRAAVEAVR